MAFLRPRILAKGTNLPESSSQRRLDDSGKLVPLAKIRGRKKAIKEMVLYATQDIGHSTAIVAYANDLEAAENLKEQLLTVNGIEQVLIMPLGPVISTHVGPGTLAIFTIGEKAR